LVSPGIYKASSIAANMIPV